MTNMGLLIPDSFSKSESESELRMYNGSETVNQ